MKRSTRISLLVFTICAAIFAFGALWYTRPNSPSYIIEEARQRQQVPLLEIKEPASRMAPTEINYDKLAEALLPKIKESLKNDSDFMSVQGSDNTLAISNAVKEYTTSTLVPSMNDKITTLVDQLSTTLYDDLSTQLTEDISTQLKDDLSAELTDNISEQLRGDLQADLTQMVDGKIQMTLDSIDINTYLPFLVDSLTPVVVEQVYDMIEANKEDFIQVSKESSSEFTEDDAKALYLEYRTQIINDIVPIILNEVEAIIQDNMQTGTVSQEEETVSDTTATTKSTTDTTSDSAEDETVEEVSASVVAQVLDSTATTSNETTDTSDEEIAIPTFYPSQTKTLTTEEYQAQRTEIRNKAISDALSKLSE